MTSLPFNSRAQIESIRFKMGQSLGEIIEAVIGDSRVRELFDLAGAHPSEYEGKPTGLMALDLNVISPATKTALLVAQAAERTYSLAEKAGDIAKNSASMIIHRHHANPSFVVEHDDPVFKFVGADSDPEILRRAQATWMGAQLLLNHEVETIRTRINFPGAVDNPASQGLKAAQGFKQAAAVLYDQASKMLRAEGHKYAADNLGDIAAVLTAEAGKEGIDPIKTINSMAVSFRAGFERLAFVLCNDWYINNYHPVEDAYKRVADLIAPPASTNPVPSAQPAAAR